MNTAGIVRWLWGPSPGAALARLPLVPLSLAYGTTTQLRSAAYRAGVLRIARLPLPAIAVGNLSVGGTGKTPLAAWIAARYVARGRKPGILLRGYKGGDEAVLLARLVPDAIVVADPDRVAGAERARAMGAWVLVLDDAFQLLGVARDLNIAVLSAESVETARWWLPAGPWRDGWRALDRADWIVVTRKRASREAAAALVERLTARVPGRPVAVAHLGLGGFEDLHSGAGHLPDVVRGRRIVAAAGIADPVSFAAQLEALGADVQLMAFQDHHAYTAGDVARLVEAGARADYVVVTEKDAVKLRGLWPHDASGPPPPPPPPPLVARVQVTWEHNGGPLERALDAAAGARELEPRPLA